MKVGKPSIAGDGGFFVLFLVGNLAQRNKWSFKPVLMGKRVSTNDAALPGSLVLIWDHVKVSSTACTNK